MDLEKLKRIKNLIIAKILFVFGWIYDLAMRILNAVNKTPIEKDKDRRNVRIKQFAIATSILYVIFNSIFIYVIISTHTLTWSVTLDVVYIWCLLNVMRTYCFI